MRSWEPKKYILHMKMKYLRSQQQDLSRACPANIDNASGDPTSRTADKTKNYIQRKPFTGFGAPNALKFINLTALTMAWLLVVATVALALAPADAACTTSSVAELVYKVSARAEARLCTSLFVVPSSGGHGRGHGRGHGPWAAREGRRSLRVSESGAAPTTLTSAHAATHERLRGHPLAYPQKSA